MCVLAKSRHLFTERICLAKDAVFGKMDVVIKSYGSMEALGPQVGRLCWTALILSNKCWTSEGLVPFQVVFNGGESCKHCPRLLIAVDITIDW